MPRNRKCRPPAEPVEARVVSKPGITIPRVLTLVGQRPIIGPDLPVLVRCGRCGQELIGPDAVLGAETWGWRLDGDTWRPTEHHRTQRRRAREASRDLGRFSPAERDRLVSNLQESRFRRGWKIAGPIRINSRFLDKVKVECPACGAVNRLSGADAASECRSSERCETVGTMN